MRVKSDRSTARYFLTFEIPLHEQDADIVLFLYRDAYYANESASPEDVDKNKAEVIVAKNRHGDLRSVPLHWQGEFMRFTSQEVVRHEN